MKLIIYKHNQKDTELIDSLHIFRRTIKADHILELAGLGLNHYHRCINQIC